MNKVVKQVSKYIGSEGLCKPADKLLVALSGGADSVALLRILLSLGYCCEAAHCNFHLRGEESDRDELFVRDLCGQLQVPLHVVHFDTQVEARKRKLSIEMAARELRYAWFEELCRQTGAARIAVAHHRDDSVETVLLNLLRGTGVNGLKGILPRNGKVIRPLLTVSRSEILRYMEELRQSYVTDSTNLQDEYTRNKIRLNLLPLMREINPQAVENILKTSDHLREAALIYNKSIEEARGRVLTSKGVSIEALLREVAPATLLFEILHPLGFNEAQVRDVLQSLSAQSGKLFVSDTHQVVKDRQYLLLSPITLSEKPLLQMERKIYTPDFVIPRDKDTACLDADKLSQPLHLRLWRSGDAFVPFGMKGRKLVSDYLTDRKFSLLQKRDQWVLCCGEEIVWLVGERTDNRYRITEQTKRVLVVKK